MCTAVWAGEDPAKALATADAEWNVVTDKIGVAAQKAAYEQFLKLPGSYADHTVEKVGLAVHLT
jgi:multiple sugar transport system substrate-binding protein